MPSNAFSVWPAFPRTPKVCISDWDKDDDGNPVPPPPPPPNPNVWTCPGLAAIFVTIFTRNANYDVIGSRTSPVLVSLEGSYNFQGGSTNGWLGDFTAYPRGNHWELEARITRPDGRIYYAYKVLNPDRYSCPNLSIDENMFLFNIAPPPIASESIRFEVAKSFI